MSVLDLQAWRGSNSGSPTFPDLKSAVAGLDHDGALAVLTTATGLQGDLLTRFLLGRFCAVPDAVVTSDAGAVKTASIAPTGARWPRGNLSWAVDLSGLQGEVSADDLKNILEFCFSQWSAACPFFSFHEAVAGESFDIWLRFRFLDGPGGFKGHGSKGDGVTFDQGDLWKATDLTYVAMHEIGHVLGLAHSTDPTSLMYPTTTGRPPVVNVEARTLLDEIYGWQGPFVIPGGSSHGASLCVSGADFIRTNEGAKGDTGLWITRSFDGFHWDPQQNIAQRGSATMPATVDYGAVVRPADPRPSLMMMWRGIQGDEALYWATNLQPSALSGFTPQQQVQGGFSATQPTLQVHLGWLYAAWRGAGNDQSLWWSYWSGDRWSAPMQIPWVGSLHGPSLISTGDELHLFWTGKSGDANVSNIYNSRLGGLSSGSPSLGTAVWESQRQVIGISDYDYDLAKNAYTAQPEVMISAATPACFVRDGQISLVMHGPDGSLRLTTRTPSAPPSPGSSVEYRWNGSVPIPGFRTQSVMVGAAVRQGRILLAGRGVGDDRALYVMHLGDRL